MRVLQISTSDRGGAGIAAVRLHLALLKEGVDSQLLTMYKLGEDIKEHYVFSPEDCKRFKLLYQCIYFFRAILIRFNLYHLIHQKLEKKYLKNQAKGFEKFSFTSSLNKLENHPLVRSADIINLHWVSDGFLDFNSFFSNCDKNIVWTLHDMNAFTGGCHHSDNCNGFIIDCAKCPQLKNTLDDDIAKKTLEMKSTAIAKIRNNQLKIITPSHWLSEKSKSSKLFSKFNHTVIPNGIDPAIFFPQNKKESRKLFLFPDDKKIILFVSHNINNPRKGINILIEAFNQLQIINPNLLLCSVGSISNELSSINNLIQLGYIKSDEQMARLYAAADVFVLPSLAENFPNTICESLFCGTPVVAFNVGGVSEQVNNSNGFIVDKINATDLKDAIEKCLASYSSFNQKTISADAVLQFSGTSVAKKYREVYSKFEVKK